MTLETVVKSFCDGAKEGWHDEKKAMKIASIVGVFPILCAIEGYKYLTTKGEANPFFTMNYVTELVSSPCASRTALACSPLAIVSVPLGIVADAVLLSSSPLYMFFKGCKNLTTATELETGLDTALMSPVLSSALTAIQQVPLIQQLPVGQHSVTTPQSVTTQQPERTASPDTNPSDDDFVLVV